MRGAGRHRAMDTMINAAGHEPDALASTDALAPGAQVGHWIVERELGCGGMAAVYAVAHAAIGKRAALKIMHRRLLGPGFNGDRMLLEAKVVNQIGHPGIIDIFEAGTLSDGRPYIVMERLDGQTLSARASASRLPPELVLEVLRQVCEALIAAHATGVVHRDLKPDNVFLVDVPDDPAAVRVKVLDWGIAKVMSHGTQHTIDGELVGTPQYLSPEQASGQTVSSQADVYSFGVMAFELFLEKQPFEAETAIEVMMMHLRAPPPRPSDLWSDIAPALESLMLSMLAKAPDDRPTMTEIAPQLAAIRAGLAVCRYVSRPRASITRVRPAVSHPRSLPRSNPRSLPRPNPRSLPRPGAAPANLARYALDAGALIVIAALLWLSDPGAAAAAANLAHGARVAACLGGVTPPPPGPPTAALVQSSAAPIVLAPAVAPSSLAPATARSRLGHSRAAAPCRDAARDPDGTFDPYQ
jgi:eukaryotic-like serine/threonine-protein kinase